MNTKKHNKALTIIEMVIAAGILAAIFAALLSQFTNINNSWASRQENFETLQVERTVASHLRDRVAVAKRIIAVSDPNETNGFLEYEDMDGITYRYEISSGDLIFGPVGNMATLAESVTELKFKCYAFDDLDTQITDVDQIRFIKAKMKIDEPSGGSKTVTVSVYLRTGVFNESYITNDAPGLTGHSASGGSLAP